MTHIVSRTPQKVWISCLSIYKMLQTYISSPWFSHFSTIVAGLSDHRYIYLQYNTGLPFVLMST